MKKHIINRISIFASILFLGAASLIQMFNELAYHFFNASGLKTALSKMPGSTIGFFEAHGLAFLWAIYFFIKFRQEFYREIHPFAIAIHLFLGTSNAIFWSDSFVRFDMVAIGIVSTILHFVLALLHLISLLPKDSHQL